MQEPQPQPAATPEPPAADHLLEDLVALTGLFDPAQIWHAEELLDDMTQAKDAPAEPTVPTEPG